MTDNIDALPVIGSTEAAVKSCVNLLAKVTGQPEAVLGYWLDLYYQVRLAYERENAPAPDEVPVFVPAEVLLPALRQLWTEVVTAPVSISDTKKTGFVPDAVEEVVGAAATAPPRKCAG